nr:immunoglobulin heavy chain junction region [Macaca mulatta]
CATDGNTGYIYLFDYW